MDEKKEEKTKETPKVDKPKEATPKQKEGDKYETTPVIERAREERERLEKATVAQKAENDRTEKIMAKKELGGTIEAGQAPVKKSEDEEWAEDAKERYKGTGLDPTDDDSPTVYA